jgi:hypothetical protein
MLDILTEIQIARPRDVVAEYAANPDNAPEWYVNIKSAEWKTPKLPPQRERSQRCILESSKGCECPAGSLS